MDPNSNPTPTPKPPLFNEPFQQPRPAQPVVIQSPVLPPDSGRPAPKSKLSILIGAAAVIELLVIIGLAVIVMNNSNSPAPAAQKSSSDASPSSQVPAAATSTGIQLTNDSISQDISNLNDDKDFPADKLDDQALGL